MEKLVITGGGKLAGEVRVSGAKNVAMKVILAGLLTDKKIVVRNIPMISSVFGTAEIVKKLGVKVNIGKDHTMRIQGSDRGSYNVPLELGGFFRTATMVLGPLLARYGKAIVPNPGGCRLGKRPIDRHIDGLKAMGAKVSYRDGFFYAQTDRLHGTKYRFCKNTHTGTEALILAAVLAEGETVLENAAEEPEIDDLIRLLNIIGCKVKRVKPRTIVIKGVKKLSDGDYEIMSDRNEVATFAIGTIASRGDIIVEGTQRKYLKAFLNKIDEIKGGWEPIDSNRTRFFFRNKLKATDIITAIYPGFMTDWQAPWVLLMTQAHGISTVKETIYEDRFGYVSELRKMGAIIDFFNPQVSDPDKFYNFNWSDRNKNQKFAIRIHGPVELHNAILEVSDLRAGATIVLAASIACGESVVMGVEHIDRGYEKIENRLRNLGVKIKRMKG